MVITTEMLLRKEAIWMICFFIGDAALYEEAERIFLNDRGREWAWGLVGRNGCGVCP